MKNGLIVLLIALGLFSIGSQAQAGETPIDQCNVVELASGLAFPWSLAELPNGDQLVSERVGTIRVIKDSVLVATPLKGVPDVFVKGQGGLFDVVLDPSFKANRTVYLSYASGKLRANHLTVVKGRLTEAADEITDVQVIYQTSPDKSTPHHYGGRMVFMADGTLLITSGEGFDHREKAQSLDNLLGKIVRINTDGSIPADNPYVGVAGAMDEIYSYGHRNPQGIVIDRQGVVYAHEHGPKGGDELNVIVPGTNYGWPAATHGLDYTGAYVSPYTTLPGMEDALLYWTPSIAASGLAYYSGDVFPEWNGDLLVTALVEKSLRRVELADGKVVAEHVMCTELGARLRDVKVGPTGVVYILTDEDPGRVLVLKAQASQHVE